MSSQDLSLSEKVQAFLRIAEFKPALTGFIIVFSFFTALLEGVGLSFIVPIIELAQQPVDPAEADGLAGAFASIYLLLGVPFSLEFIIAGVAIVMVARYTSSFVVAWFREALRAYYVRELQTVAFDNALDARVSYFDEHGSDEIINAIVTQAEYAGKVIRDFVRLFEKVLLSIMYLAIAFYLAPVLTLLTIVFLGGLTYLIRNVIEPGYAVGDRVADANEEVQETVQAGMQGIRDVKLFTMGEELFASFSASIEKFTDSMVALGRNEAAMDNIYSLSMSIMVFVLIYVALTFTAMSLGALGVFLFAMFQLAPQVSEANHFLYKVEGNLPHLVRTQRFTRDLRESQEIDGGDEPAPRPVEHVEYDNVTFSYDGSERVLEDVSFSVEREEFIAFVGQSGAGKSTIVSLLARLYEPDDGEITANGRPIERFDLESWRKRIAFVRQDPFIFNDTLRANLTIGKRDATDEEIERACEIAHLTDVIEELPAGYDTELGDDGVRFSGGQRQRVSLARALLTDADVLVLDEATSDLDTTIEREVQSAIETMDREYAMIAIAHRLSTVKNADRIYALEDGQIEEVGTHEELVENEGTYAKLYATQ